MDKKLFNITVIIKTFLRPPCLVNILNSIEVYQNEYNIKFAEVIIIDDGDASTIEENKVTVAKHSNSINLQYKDYEFNTIGLSKGRNIAVDIAKCDYLLLCDDDFILDLDCDLEKNLQKLINEECDILGGYFKDIDDLSQIRGNNYQPHNWISYMNQTGNEDILLLFDNYFPEFSLCFSVHNFFLAKTSAIKRTRWNEDLPLLEHIEFFDRANKEQHLKIAFTNELYVRHFHIDMKRTNYKKYRERKINYTQKTPLKGYYISKESVRSFSDYRIHTDVFYEKNFIEANKSFQLLKTGNKIQLKFLFIELKINAKLLFFYLEKTKITYLLKTVLSFSKKWITYFKNFKNNSKRIKEVKTDFPEVLSTKETLSKLLKTKQSLSRFGDGEFKLIKGISLGEKGTANEYQTNDHKLSERLKEVLNNPPDGLMVSIIPFESKSEDIKHYKNGLSYYQDFWLDHWDDFKNYLNRNKNIPFGNANISRIGTFLENDVTEIKKLWDKEEAVFVVGKRSHFVSDDRLFDNLKSKEFYYAPSKSAFSSYDTILSEVSNFSKNKLILIALGPTATVLAADLTKMGYRALDIGHLPNCYQQFMGEKDRPEVEHWN